MTAPSFLRFLRQSGFRPTAAQRVLILVAFDGINPADLSAGDRDIARVLFGNVERIPAEARRIVSMVKGARIGGTRIAALYGLFCGVTADASSLAPGEALSVLLVGPDLRLSRQALRFARGAADVIPSLAGAISKDGDDGFELTRPDGRVVRFEILPATRGGSALRGRSLGAAVMTEGAFFRDAASGIVNDAEIVRAIVPRLMPGAKLIIESTPWLASGVLFENDRQWGAPRSCLPTRAPTLFMRPSPEMEAFVAEERSRDEANARREFDAQFLDSGAGLVFDGGAITRGSEHGVVLPGSPNGSAVGIGGDLGFASDSSALCAVQWDHSGHLVVVVVEELRPMPGAPLVPSEVAVRFADVVAPWRARKVDGSGAVFLDAHYIESARENFGKLAMRVRALPGGADGKADTYRRVQELLHRDLLWLPQHPRLLGQLREVTARPLSGGGTRIESPRRAGHGHGDLVSALVAAVYALDHAAPVDAVRAVAPPPLEQNARGRGGDVIAAHDFFHDGDSSTIPMPGLAAQLASTIKI